MSQYMLLIHDGDWGELSPEEMQQTVDRYIAWSRKLADEKRLVAADALKPDGKVLSVKGGKVVDGPYTETKDAIGGYFIYEADSLEHATEIARECPTFAHNGYVQIREISASPREEQA